MSQENKQLERRVAVTCELRADEPSSGPPKIVGYAARFNTLSSNLGGFFEKIKRGAFKRSLSEKPDVRALIDHDSAKILGRSTAGTLRMKEDAEGLRIEIDPPDTQTARDLMVSIKRGDISQMSFAFRTVTDRWNKQDGEQIRELVDVDLLDVSVVTYPAYPDTSVAVRSLELHTQTEDAGDGADERERLRRQVELEEAEL